MINDYFKIALYSVFHRRLRSFLTIIGIFIGVAAIIALISVGQGLENAITEQFENLGTDKILVQPAGALFGSGPGTIKLKEEDVDEIEKVRGVEIATPSLFKGARVEFKGDAIYSIVYGTITDPKDQALYIDAGSELLKGDILRPGDTHKALVGYLLGESASYFRRPLEIGDSFFINGEEFSVLGIFKKVGHSQDDTRVVIPYEAAKEVLQIRGTEVDIIFVQTQEGFDPSLVADSIERRLRQFKDEKEGSETFDVQTSEQLLNTLGVILDIVTYILIGIAAISLLVGGIGIMNTMYMAVLERTREIGVLKAVGARNSHILTLFLLESGFLGFVGGLLGVLFGLGFAFLVSFFARLALGSDLIHVEVSFPLVFGTLFFSVVLGALSGALPARQASLLKPVESLRYE